MVQFLLLMTFSAVRSSLQDSIGSRDIFIVKVDSLGDTLWTRTYGGPQDDWASWITPTLDSGYVVVGATDSFETKRLWLLKVDSSGDTAWTKVYEHHGAVSASCYVSQTSDSGYIVCGSTTISLRENRSREVVWLLKLDRNGDTLWTHVYNKPILFLTGGRTVYEAPDKGYIILAECEQYYGFALLKTDSLGNILWTRSHQRGASGALSMVMTRDDGFLVVGSAKNLSKEEERKLRIGLLGPLLMGDAWLVKLDSLGRYEWDKTYAFGAGITSGDAITLSDDDGYVVTGCVFGYLPKEGRDFSELIILKVDSNGRIIWLRSYPEYDTETSSIFHTTRYKEWVCLYRVGVNAGEGIIRTSDSGYIIITLGGGLVKTDSLGMIQWRMGRDFSISPCEIIDEHTTPEGNEIFSLKDGSYITRTLDGEVTETDSLGNIVCRQAEWLDITDDIMITGKCVQQTPDGGYILLMDKEPWLLEYE